MPLPHAVKTKLPQGEAHSPKNRRRERYEVREKTKPQIEAQRSGFNLERRSDGVSERWRLLGTKKRRRERYEVREKGKPQIEAQRSGFNLERRSDGVNER